MLQATARHVLAPLARLLYRPIVEGVHHVPRHGPVILAANHLAAVDSIVIPLVVPRPVVFLAKAEYFDGRGVTGRLRRAGLGAVHAIPVRRGAHHAARAALDTALGVLTAGGAFGIHPEGSRSRDGRLYRGRTGVAWLALASGAPVVPVAVIGTDRIQPVGTRLPRIAPVTVRFGAALHFRPPATGSPARARRQATDDIMAAIGRLSGQQPAGQYNSHSTDVPDMG